MASRRTEIGRRLHVSCVSLLALALVGFAASRWPANAEEVIILGAGGLWRLVSLQDGRVTFRYKPHTGPWQTMTLPAHQVLSRFLQHGLPTGFQKIRYYGFLHPGAKATFTALKQRLDEAILDPKHWPAPGGSTTSIEHGDAGHTPDSPGLCPHCGAPLRYVGRLARWPPRMLPVASQ